MILVVFDVTKIETELCNETCPVTKNKTKALRRSLTCWKFSCCICFEIFWDLSVKIIFKLFCISKSLEGKKERMVTRSANPSWPYFARFQRLQIISRKKDKKLNCGELWATVGIWANDDGISGQSYRGSSIVNYQSSKAMLKAIF